MKQEIKSVKQTINSFLTPKGILRTLTVELEGNNVDIYLSYEKSGEQATTNVNLNKYEAIQLVFYLVRALMPNNFIGKKWKKEENLNQNN